MKNYLFQFILSLVLVVTAGRATAQAPGSVEAIGGTIGEVVYSTATGNTTSSVSETLYLGPGIYQVDGTWEIYSKNVWISPDAVIAGTGTLIYFNPSVAGGAASPTLIDGNNNAAFLNINIELQNAANMVLTDIAGPGVPWNDAVGNANLTVGNNFTFAVANGDVLLGNHDMITATAAALLGYQPDRFVVTNGTGHLVHNNYTGAFTYPVGIAEGDYTPAAVSPAISNTIHVLVQNYATSASEETGLNGIDRTWNIYGDNAAANALINLQHSNMAGSTNQASYNDAACFVTQYSSTTPNTTGQTTTSTTAWQSNNPAPGSGTGTLTTGSTIATASERSLTYTTLATSAAATTAFFSKSSGPIMPLPVTLKSFEGRSINCTAILRWITAEESNMSYFELQSSANGTVFTPVAQVGPKGSNSTYAYTDANITAPNMQYRLRMVSKDGGESYSKIVALNINCNDAFEIKVYPTIVDDKVIISGLASKSQLRLIDATGKVLSSIIATSSTQQIDMSKLANAVYILQVMQDNKMVKSVKLVKK